MAAASHIGLPGHRTTVLLPTLYGIWPQQALRARSIGDALAIDNAADAGAIRAQIEAQGILCGGWSVPRGGGSLQEAQAEGYAHGQVAAQFDHFILNYEQWRAREMDPSEEYWQHPQDDSYVDAFMDGFSVALREAQRDVLLGITWVANSMFANAGDDVERAWLKHADYVALEAYYPGDANLDPARSLQRWRDHCLNDLGIEPVPAVAIVAQGDFVSDAAAVSDPVLGVGVWTCESASAGAWPVGGLV